MNVIIVILPSGRMKEMEKELAMLRQEVKNAQRSGFSTCLKDDKSRKIVAKRPFVKASVCSGVA